MSDGQSETNSRVFALRAAQWVGCSGAHKFEGKWMPCETHQELQRLSNAAEPKRKTGFAELHERYDKRKVKGRKKKRGWEKLNETKPLGFATLEGGGIVSAPINSTIYSGGIVSGSSSKAYIPGVSPRDNDPDVFTDIESARKRSRMLGCIGVRRLSSTTGRTIWMPCTSNTDYARRAGTTFLGRRGQQETQRRMLRSIVRDELASQNRNRNINLRKKSLFGELNETKGMLGRALGRAISPGSLSRRMRRGLRSVAKIEGVTDPRLRRDSDGDGMIFDGTWREMPDPSRATTTGKRNLRSTGEGESASVDSPTGVKKLWWESKNNNKWLGPEKITKGGKLKAAELLKFDRVRSRKTRDEQARALGVSRETIDAMYENDASLDPQDADKLSILALDLHPALIWGEAWLEPDPEKPKRAIRKNRDGSLDKRGAGRELNDRDKKILEMRAAGATLQDIADELKISKERARQLFAAAILRNTKRDEDLEKQTLRSQGASIARGDGMIQRDTNGIPTRQADRRREALDTTIAKLKDIGFSDEEINLLMTGDRDTPVDTVTRDVDTSKARRLRSTGRLNSPVGLRSSGFSISTMEKTKSSEWPQSSKTHIVNWANGRPSFNVPYSLAEKHKNDGDLSDRDWKVLLKFYKNYGPENNSGRRLRSSGNTDIDSSSYLNIGAKRMARIILDRVKPESRNKPAGRRKHYHIIGPGGVGKSTLSKYLKEQGLIPDETDAAHIDPDFIKVGIAGYEGGKGSELVHRESAHSATYAVGDAAREGMDIVTEGTGLRLYDYKTTKDNTYEKVFHIPFLPYDIAEERVKKRNADGGRQLPVSQIRQKGSGLYGWVTESLRNGGAQTMYIWDMDVPEGAAPQVIAKIENGVFESFDDIKFKQWATQHGGRGGDSDIDWFARNFPTK